MRLTDLEMDQAIKKIKETLGDKNLANELEMIVKHIPTYEKIIKNHIMQLKNVLALDNHQNKTIENINLSPTIQQLINIFDKLEANDLAKLEELKNLASNWHKEKKNSIDIITSEATI